MAVFIFCQIIRYIVKTLTLLKLQDWDFIKIFKTRDLNSRRRPATSKVVHFAKIFQKNVIITTSQLNFFLFLTFFWPVLVVSYLQIQQRNNSLNYKSFTKQYPCNIQSLRLVTETCSLQDRDEAWNLRDWDRLKTKSQDSITAYNSNKIVESTKLLNLLTYKIYHLLWSSIGPHARQSCYKQFNSNEILQNNNLT